MIVVQLIGGLGNQMFQYALAKSLQLTGNYEVKLDITGYRDYRLHNYAIDNFKLSLDIATEEEIEVSKSRQLIREPQFNYWENIFEINESCYIEGYWQSELYFNKYRDVILEEYSTVLSSETKEFVQMLKNEKITVSMHIRRGDYVWNPITNKFHGTCDVNYYIRAVKFLKSKYKEFKLVIFSDDFIWVKEVLLHKLDDVEYLLADFNGVERNYEDILIMSECNHNIIANSSFSWWGAWLNKNPEKFVLAPEKWFNDSPLNSSTIVPMNWYRM